MKKVLATFLVLAPLTVSASGPRPAQAVASRAAAAPVDGVRSLLLRLEQIVQAGNTRGYLDLLAVSADRPRAIDFSSFQLLPGATRAIVQERDRAPLSGTPAGTGYRLMVDIFAEYRGRARVATWRLDVRRGGGDDWQIADQEQVMSLESLYHLALNPNKQFEARDLRIAAEDLDLTLAEGSVFVSDTDQGVTGIVLMGRGEMRFHPEPEMERSQVKIFCGAETLEARFEAAFLRINPSDFNDLISAAHLRERPVDARDFRRATDVFQEEVPKSFGVDLGDLSRESWTLMPSSGDLVAEVRTRRFNTLTYARSSTEAEDITLFDRKRHRNVALYSSAENRSRRGRFYNEDEIVDYDVLDYDINLAVTPDRQWLEGRARMRVKVRAAAIGTLTLRLADSLTVQSIVSDEFGYFFGLRVKNQNSIVVNLPAAVPRDSELALTIAYAGRLPPQSADRETLALEPSSTQDDATAGLYEPTYLYSNRNYWYPQATVTDYATATLRLNIPDGYDCVASGDLAAGSPVAVGPKNTPQARKLYTFSATQPLRYLAFLVSRFVRTNAATIELKLDPAKNEGLPPMPGASYRSLNLTIESNPRQVVHARRYAERAADVAQFYASILGDCPYPSFTLALVENDLPGGHSPGYFAALNQPVLALSSWNWRNDPAAFTNYPEFFLAHELAHQWWGQAIGWRNYHEQWLSEGFAQYFAALYAQHHRGDDVFAGVMRQLRRWGLEESDQGPVYLGYRIGHIRADSRVFRAVVYNKSAAVLHMLRRFVGDEAFFRGLRRFYRVSRFHKAGTEDFREAMEVESGRSLERFFERWIYGATLPKLKFGYRVEAGASGQEAVLHVEQIGELFDVPLTLTLQYADHKAVDVLVPVTERVVDMRVPLAGTLRGVEINKNEGTLVEFLK